MSGQPGRHTERAPVIPPWSRRFANAWWQFRWYGPSERADVQTIREAIGGCLALHGYRDDCPACVAYAHAHAALDSLAAELRTAEEETRELEEGIDQAVQMSSELAAEILALEAERDRLREKLRFPLELAEALLADLRKDKRAAEVAVVVVTLIDELRAAFGSEAQEDGPRPHAFQRKVGDGMNFCAVPGCTRTIAEHDDWAEAQEDGGKR